MSLNVSRTLVTLSSLVLLAGCNLPTSPLPTQVTNPTAAAMSATTPAALPTSALVDTFTPTAAPPNTPAPSTTSAPAATSTPNAPGATSTPSPATDTPPAATSLISGYLDDRSTAIGVIQSLFNAVNRREYVRAYAYWESPGQSTQPGVPASFAQFQRGYQDTASVQLVTGAVGSDAGAGQIYYSVPVAMKAQTTGGQTQVFSGCYVLHLARPEIQDAPPFQPLSIFSAQVKQQDAGADLNNLAAHGCDYLGSRQISSTNPMPTTDPNDITAANYLDDRSDPVLVVKSLLNAINSRQYDRAYSYWSSPASGNVPPYAQFKQGYADTASVEVSFGNAVGNGAAGSIFFTVPTALKVKTTDGKTQTYVGCYLERMRNPGAFTEPPFTPLGIEKGRLQPVDNNADVAALLKNACENMTMGN